MRFAGLDLLSYGRFTDRTLSFPAAECDVHVIYGANEAGKSTLRTATADFLFGIQKNSTLKFLPEHTELRLGAVLEQDGLRLDALRRKGLRNTLLGRDGAALPNGEAALQPFVHGVDRTLYERMFSLDHDRLREGGEALLSEKDDVGRMLFGASAGLGELRTLSQALEQEAETLWGQRSAAHRRFTQIETRLDDARRALRESTVTEKNWAALQEAVRDATKQHQALTDEIRERHAESSRLNRIRRIAPMMRERDRLFTEWSGLGEVPRLPDDVTARLEAVCRARDDAAARLDVLRATRAECAATLESTVFDARLAAAEEDVVRLDGERSATTRARADLVSRRRERVELDAEITRLARELDWGAQPTEVILGRIPLRRDLDVARALIETRTDWTHRRQTASQACDDAAEQDQEAARVRAQLGVAEDTTALAGLVEAARGDAGLDTELSRLAGTIAERGRRIATSLTQLRPAVSNLDLLTAAAVPAPEEVEAHERARIDASTRLEKVRDRLAERREQLAGRLRDRQRLETDEQAVSADTLAAARVHRDLGWALIEREYVRREPVAAPELDAYRGDAASVPAEYVAAVAEADRLGDRRYDKAAAGARLEAIVREIADLENQIEALLTEEIDRGASLERLEAEWRGLWSGAAVEPLAPATMRRWLENRTELLALRGDLELERAAHATAVDRRTRIRAALCAALTAVGVGVDILDGESLEPVIAAAKLAVDARQQRNAERDRLDKEQARAGAVAVKKRAALVALDGEAATWRLTWAPTFAALGLEGTIELGTARVQVGALDELREKASEALRLQKDRIEKIERDIEAFEATVAACVSDLAPDLGDRAADAAIAELRRRCVEAREAATRTLALQEQVEGLDAQIRELDAAGAAAARQLAALQQDAGVDTLDALRLTIERSDRRRALDLLLDEKRLAIAGAGDGMTEDALASECASTSADRAVARLDELATELEDLRQRQDGTRDALTAATRDFEAIGGDDRAARAQSAVNAAAAELREVAEEYLRVRLARRLLDWAVERYRRARQGPMLARAGTLFSNLTGGGFVGLALRYDDADVARVVGVRTTGAEVAIDAMSDGTRDQLFLALRVAALEHYLDSSAGLPFIADDLFINFDEARASAGLALLGALGRRIQVIYFTHHQHVVDLARKTLGAAVSVIEL